MVFICFLFTFSHSTGVFVYQQVYIDYGTCFRTYCYDNDQDDEFFNLGDSSHVHHDFLSET